MNKEIKPEAQVRLLGLYKTGHYNDFEEFVPSFVYQKGEEPSKKSLMLVESEIDKMTLSFLQMLHPQARHFLTPAKSNDLPPSVRVFSPDSRIKDELEKSVWQVKAPKWAVEHLSNFLSIDENNSYFFQFRIQNLHFSIFPTGIIILNATINPVVAPGEENISSITQLIINTLHNTGTLHSEQFFRCASFHRTFSHPKQKESVLRRFENNSSTVFLGFMGQELSLEDIFISFLPSDYKRLLGDRFINCTFIKSSWKNEQEVFSEEDFADLIRVARGENKNYVPLKSECNSSSDTITMTFENVAFVLSAEGVACWIKPTEDQSFLKGQFKQRFDTIYFQLFQLALHQKYILIDIAERLDRATPSLNELQDYHHDDLLDASSIYQDARQLRHIRSEVANFYLRAFFNQPAALTNHQEFYRKLQEVFSVSELFSEVQQATNELDYLISNLQERINDNQHTTLLSQISALMHRQEQSAHIEFFLTLIVEAIAIPYYTYNFLAHAFHMDAHKAKIIGLSLAGGAILFTLGNMIVFKITRKKKKDKKHKT